MEKGSYVIVPKEDWELLMQRIASIEDDKREFYTHDELKARFKWSDQTIRRMRDDGELGFSQPLKKTYIYKKKDVDSLIYKNYRRPFNA